MGRHRSVLIGYALPVMATVLAVTGWFRPEHFIAAGDVSPFIRANLAPEWWSLWSHQSSGTGSTSYEAGRGVEICLLTTAHALHLSDVVAQWALFALCCGLASFGSAFFAASWLRRPGVIAAVGCTGAFNAFQLVNLPNLLPAVAIGVGGLLGGLLLRRAQGRQVSALKLAAASVPLSYLSLNPPLLVVVLAWGLAVACAGRLLVGPGGSRRAVGLALRAMPLAVAVNAWWLLPFVIANLSPAGVAFTAQTDVGAWAWSQARNSIPNVLTLTAHWGWTHPEYFPYAASMDAAPLSWARWIMPVLAIAGAIRPSAHRRAALPMGASLAILVFVAKGLHPPFTDVNMWLFDHVPGMWLLREPMSKVGPLLVLLLGALAGLLIEGVLDKPPSAAAVRLLVTRLPGFTRLPRLTRLHEVVARLGGARPIAGVAVTLCVAAGIAYPWPLWTGAVVPDGTAAQPGAHVAVPAAWRTTAAQVNRSGGVGSVLVLPLDPFYQVTTSWGYHGVDSIPQQLFDRPVLHLLPGGYLSPTAGVQSLISDVNAALLRKDPEGARRRLQSLGVSAVVVRRDLVSGPSDLPHADPNLLIAGMAGMAGASVISDTSVSRAWRLDGGTKRVEADSTLLANPTRGNAVVSAAVANLPEGMAATRDAVATEGITWMADGHQDRAHFTLPQAGTYRLRSTYADGAHFRGQVQQLPRGQFRVSLTPTAMLTLDGRAVPLAQTITFPVVTGRPVALMQDGVVQPLADGTIVNLTTSAHLSVLTDPGLPARQSPPVGTGDCNNTPGEPARGLATAVLPGAKIRLTGENHAACAWWNVTATPGTGPLLVDVSGRAERGSAPRVCLYRPVDHRCLAPMSMSEDGGTRTWSFIDPAPETNGTQLYVYADGTAGGTSIVYNQPGTRRLQVAATGDSGVATPELALPPLSAGPHDLNYAGDLSDPPTPSLSAVEDCDNSGHGVGSAGLAAQPIARGMQLRASADAACAWTAPADTRLANRYTLSVSYRTVSGLPARVCLWEIGPNRCAELPALAPDGANWRTLTADIVPDPGTQGLRMYVYADGQAAPDPTVTEYRDLVLRPSAPVGLAVYPAAVHRPPDVTSTCQAPRCEVSVRGVEESFVLRLNDSYAPDWGVSGLPRGWTAQHVELDSYANGWLISGRGNASFVVAYGPSRIVSLAQAVSAVSSLAIAGVALLLWGRRQRTAPSGPGRRRARRPRFTTTTGREQNGTP